MIDLHSHILPGIDDGASSLEEALSLAVQASEQGVTHMMCTPHINEGVFNNNIETIKTSFEVLVSELRHSKINLKLSMACEIRLNASIVSDVLKGRLLFIGIYNDKKALLLELPHSHIPAGADTLIMWLLKNGIQPVIPHPERNRDVIANYERVLWLRKLGCLFQITAGSLLGRFNDNVQKIAHRMLEDKLADFVASDLHSLKRRPCDMRRVYEYIQSEKGTDFATKLCYDFPKSISESSVWV